MKPHKYFSSLVVILLGVSLFCPLAFAAPIEISSCQAITEPGSYVLGTNLIKRTFDPDRACIRISANSVTLDLGGFRIKGNGVGGTAIKKDNFPRTGIVIRNGSIVSFDTGINLSSSAADITIESVDFIDNVTIGADVDQRAQIKNCKFFGNGRGLRVGSHSRVVGNLSDSNKSTAIEAGSGSLVDGNVAGQNTNDGFVIRAGSTVSNNTARSNSGTGITVTCPSNVIGNTATANGTNLTLVGGGCNDSNNVAP